MEKYHGNSEGRLWVENHEHFKCGKVKKQVKYCFKFGIIL